jgi:MFS family permease
VTLAIARACIGLGVSACLMGSFKAFSQWFPAERLPSLTAGYLMTVNGATVDAFAGSGLTRDNAFRLTFSVLLAAQGLAFAWFLVPVQIRQLPSPGGV